MTHLSPLSEEAHQEHCHTVDTLIAELTELKKRGVPGDTVVVLAKDAEGNDFSPLTNDGGGVDHAMYLPNSTWSGYHYMSEADRLSLDDAHEYEPAPDDAFPAVFLWPVN